MCVCVCVAKPVAVELHCHATALILVIGKAQFRRAMLSCDSSCFLLLCCCTSKNTILNQRIHHLRPILCLNRGFIIFTCMNQFFLSFLLVYILNLGLFSSPEPLDSQGELIVYPSSRRPSVSVVRPSTIFKDFLL